MLQKLHESFIHKRRGKGRETWANGSRISCGCRIEGPWYEVPLSQVNNIARARSAKVLDAHSFACISTVGCALCVS